MLTEVIDISWNSMPIRNIIMVILEKRKGVIIDDELIKIVNKKIGRELSESEINNVLMRLEIQGFIHVSQITKSKRRIEIIKGDMGFVHIDEE